MAGPIQDNTVQKSDTDGPRHRVVFEVTVDGDDQWTAVLNNIENLRIALGAERVEIAVIAHAQGLGMLLGRDHGERASRMKSLAHGGVTFAACENSMQKKDVTKEHLLSFATTVDSGVAEVVRKQQAGWSYLKSGI